jgi:hypothetical protein
MTLTTGRTTTITAEWALWGKESHDRDYRLLRCSVGTFSPQDFVYAIDRYSPGTLPVRTLPQVSVSWLKHPQTGLPSHLGLAIHETAAADDPRSGQARAQFDAAGREIVFVRYFCVPYEDLAAEAASYRQLYNAFRRRGLFEQGRDPITADLDKLQEQPPGADESLFAEHVAAQLLTTQPVCILGADQMPLDRRLRFIDLVMSGLTYGTRTQLSAATWVNSNFTAHKLRLFFASASRDDPGEISGPELGASNSQTRRKPDVVVKWGHLETARATDRESIEYLSWDGLGQPWAATVLAQETTPVDLKDKGSIKEMLRRVQLGNIDQLTLPDTLRYLGENLRTGAGRDTDIPQYIDNLVTKGARHLSKETREECWALIGQYDLLTDNPRVRTWRDQLYDGLLGVTFDGPVTYERYLRIQDSMRTPLNQNVPLLRALERRQKMLDIPWLLIRRGLGDTDEELMITLAQGSMPAPELARCLVAEAVRASAQGGAGDRPHDEPVLRPDHGRLLFGPALEYLLRYGRGDHRELRQFGYLAPALNYYYADDKQAQVTRAIGILRSVYGSRLGRADIEEVLGASDYRPTDALLAAVINLAPGHAEFAMTEYGRARSADLVPVPRNRGWRSRVPSVPRLRSGRPRRRRGLSVTPSPALTRVKGVRPQSVVLTFGLLVIAVMIVLIYVIYVH